MRMALHLLLLLIPYEGCTSDPTFKTENVTVGRNVSMRCLRDSTRLGFLIWIRLVSGAFPEFLAQTSISDLPKSLIGESNRGDRITARKEPGLFVLHIHPVQKSDMAVYYCLHQAPWLNEIAFLNGIFLQVTDLPETKPSISAVTQDLWSDRSRPRPSMTSRCSVISRSENKSCADGHRVYWFSAGTENANPSFVYAHEECKKENGSVQKCVYAFSKNVSSSDAGTYSCAVAACGEIFMGNAKKVIIEDGSGCDFQMTVICVLGAALALNFIVSAFLRYKIKTKTCFYCQACQRTHDQTRSRMQQRNEDSLVYSAPTILTRKSGKASPTSTRTIEDFSTYTDVCLRESKRDENDETA